MTSRGSISLETFKQMIDLTLHGAILTDPDLNIVYVNDAFTHSTGYKREEVLGKNAVFLRSGLHSPKFYEDIYAQLHRTGQWQGETWNIRKNGETFAEWENISVIRDAEGNILHYAAIFSDITERKQVEARLREQAYVDDLTGVYNRRFFNESVENELNRAKRHDYPLTLMLVDIDFFKAYNDNYGHLQGDSCLSKVAATLSLNLRRGGDSISRIGGEEFALLMPGLSAGNASRIAELLVQSIRELQIENCASPTRQITISLGAASSEPGRWIGGTELFELADQALYRAKEKGRDNAQINVCT